MSGLRARLGVIQVRSAEQAGAKGDGRADDTAALQSWLDTPHAVLQLSSGKTYRITHSLILRSGNAIVGYGAPTGTLLMSASGFTCVASAGCKYDVDPSAVGIFVRDPRGAPLENIVLDDFAIVGEGRAEQGRTLMAISCSNVVNFRVARLDISRLSNAIGVRCSGLSGSSAIERDVIHDFADLSPGPLPNLMAGISIDLDAGGRTPATTRLAITGNRVTNIRYGSVFAAKYDQQASGIVVAGGTGVVAARNTVIATGQGVDWHASNGAITDNIVHDADLFCLKLIHGASNNHITGNTVAGCGIAGISLGGGNSRRDVANNDISGNIISAIDPHGAYGAHDTAAILILHSSMSGRSVANQINDNAIDPGNGKWAIADFDPTDRGNLVKDSSKVRPGVAGRYRLLAPTDAIR